MRKFYCTHIKLKKYRNKSPTNGSPNEWQNGQSKTGHRVATTFLKFNGDGEELQFKAGLAGIPPNVPCPLWDGNQALRSQESATGGTWHRDNRLYHRLRRSYRWHFDLLLRRKDASSGRMVWPSPSPPELTDGAKRKRFSRGSADLRPSWLPKGKLICSCKNMNE